ncbi:MAG: crossover junction endodeoxyribonuclease RuvC, partial [Campylobacterota bacterium]|nr:crossover junction endodeoxyribonuclease RuvC [Campylobacterota bacterium]
MIILGIDPGTIKTGYAILEVKERKMLLKEAGLIKIKTKELQSQICEIVEALDVIFANHQIKEVAIEDMFYAHNPQSVIKLAQFRGAVALKIIQVFG